VIKMVEIKDIYKEIRRAGMTIDGFRADYVSPGINPLETVVEIQRDDDFDPYKVAASVFFSVQDAHSDKIDTIEDCDAIPLELRGAHIGIRETREGAIEEKSGSLEINTKKKIYQCKNISKEHLKEIRKIMKEHGYKRKFKTYC
jgi:hypothetical protein